MGNNIKNEYKNIIPEKTNNILPSKISINLETTNLTNQQNKRIIKNKKINYNLRAIVFIIIIILFILFRLIYLKLYFVLMNNIKSDDDEYDENFKPDNETIYYKEKFDSYIEAFNKSKDFINNNLKGILYF